MEELHRQKQALRRQVQAACAAFPPAYLAASDAAIRQRLLPLLPPPENGPVFCYVSVGTEPDTRALIKTLLQSGRRVCVPRCRGGGEMEAREITGLSMLHPAPFGLLEPEEDTPLVAPETLGAAIVPCVAADENGHRLGHGAGYYDRYLPRTRCPALCLCRARLLHQALPAALHDIPMTAVITETGVYPAVHVGMPKPTPNKE